MGLLPVLQPQLVHFHDYRSPTADFMRSRCTAPARRRCSRPRSASSANFVDFVTADDGASAHDAHLDAALSDYDNEFSTLQLQSGRLDGKRSAPERD